MNPKEESITTSFNEISQKISQLEARFIGPLNPQIKSQQDLNKHIQPVRSTINLSNYLGPRASNPRSKQELIYP